MDNRNVFFNIDGLLGLIVAVLVLIAVLIGLVTLSVMVQNDNASNYYNIVNETEIGSGIMGKNISNRADHIIDVK